MLLLVRADYSYCSSSVLMGTVALCLDQRYPKQAQHWWSTQWVKYCTPETLPEYAGVLSNATQNIGSVNITGDNAVPFLIPDDIFDVWRHTTFAYYDNVFLAQTYGWIIVVLGCIVMAVAGLLRLLNRLNYTNELIRRCTRAIQQYISVPATFGQAHARRPKFLGIEFSIPTRLESVFLVTFIIINIVLDFVSFEIFDGNMYWSTNIDQFNRYVADRSGILSFAQFPFLFAFAGRNTIFIWITGWSYQSFSVFHKWVARVAVAHAFLHTIMYTDIAFRYNGAAGLTEYYEDAYIQWGAAAMTAGLILITGSIYTVRKL